MGDYYTYVHKYGKQIRINRLTEKNEEGKETHDQP